MSSKTLAHGVLQADTDSWLLVAGRVTVLDLGELDGFDGSLEHALVSVVGTMTSGELSSRSSRLIVDQLVSHDRIRIRAHQLSESEPSGTAADHWLRAERELLGV